MKDLPQFSLPLIEEIWFFLIFFFKKKINNFIKIKDIIMKLEKNGADYSILNNQG